MKSLDRLFSPIKIGPMEVKNRVVMSPMTTSYAAEDGSVSEKMLHYYEARAKGGVGLMILESTTIDGMHPYQPRTLGLWDDSLIPSYRGLVERLHAHGARVAPQVIHPGPESLSVLHGIQPVGPSVALCKTTGQMCRELTVEEIGLIVDQFGEAARRAREAGCDGLELDSAHCYKLMGSFLSPLRNRRTDSYGGPVEGRLQFALEIINSIRARAGRDFPIIMRLSGDEMLPGGHNLEDTLYIAAMLAEAGVDAFDISGGVVLGWFSRVVPPTGSPLGLNAPHAAAVKGVVPVPVMVVGRINNPWLAESILARGQADMVVLGRALLADPDFVNKATEGRFDDIAPCLGCGLGCIGELTAGRSMTCLMNPAVGREREMALVPAARRKKVLVAGGGPAGLETARVAALRGHQVTLMEKEAKLGGQFNLAAAAPLKQELSQAIKYLAGQVAKAGVTIELNTPVTPEKVDEIKPDVLVVATGSEPAVPALAGAGGARVVTAHDVLAGRAIVRSRNVVVIGGGMVGCEVADFLADVGDNPQVRRTAVTLVEMRPEIGYDRPTPQASLLLKRLRDKNVRIVTSAEVKEVLDDGVIVTREGHDEAIRGMGCIVLATGARPVDSISEMARGGVSEVYKIGDASQPRLALEAIAEGAEVARSI